MSDQKPYWSTVPGVVTGAASILTAIVGLLGISLQAGWIGGDDGDKTSSSAGVPTTMSSTASTTSTRVGASSTAPSVTVRVGEFTVAPDSVTFEPLKAKEATVTVKNTGDVPLTMRKPTVTGSSNFKATDMDCATSVLAAGRSCKITVTFASAPIGEYEALLVVAAANAPRQVEVELTGTVSLLG